jgi:hypothetical protein
MKRQNAIREAARLKRTLTTSDRKGEVVDALSDILIELSNDSQIFWDEPTVARALFLAASKLDEYDRVAMRLEQIRTVMDKAERGESLVKLMRSWGYTSNPRWQRRTKKGGAR